MTSASSIVPAGKKVLIVFDSPIWSGVGMYLLDLIRALMEAGHSVTLLGAGNVPEAVLARFRHLGCGLMQRDFGLPLSPKVISIFREFSQVIADVRPDVIFFNRFGDYALPYMIETAEIRRVKRIVTVEHWLPSAFPDFANTRAPMLRRAINRLHYAVMMRRLDGIICISHKAREVFAREYCFPLSRMQTIHNGVNLSRFRFDVSTRSTCRRELDAGDRVVIACCGRLAQEKGVDVFLEALACIPPRELETVLAIIVGDGPLMESLREQAQRLGIQDRVRFLGHHEDVNSCLCACDIFVMPSRQEPFGLSFAEAMAVGRYVIATRVGGIPEVLSDPNLGKLIDPESPDQLADAIVGAMKDPRLREQIGRKAAEHIAAHFNVEQTVARTLEMILG